MWLPSLIAIVKPKLLTEPGMFYGIGTAIVIGVPMFVYGNGTPNESLIIRLFAPDNTIAVFEQIMTKDDGSFHYMAWQWDEPTENLPFGSYILEVISNQQGGLSQSFVI